MKLKSYRCLKEVLKRMRVRVNSNSLEYRRRRSEVQLERHKMAASARFCSLPNKRKGLPQDSQLRLASTENPAATFRNYV